MSFKRFIHVVLIHSLVFRRLRRITFEVYKNLTFVFFQALLVPTLKPGVLQAVARVSEERAFSRGERSGWGLVPTQVTEEEAHLQSDQWRGSGRLPWVPDFRSYVLLIAMLFRGRKASCM